MTLSVSYHAAGLLGRRLHGLLGAGLAVGVLAVGLPASTLPAAAQSVARPDGAEVFSDFLACDEIARPDERLICYDAALKKYKLRFGLLKGTPEDLARAQTRSRVLAHRPVIAPVGGQPVLREGDLGEKADSPLEEKTRRHRLAKATPGRVEATIVKARKDPLGYWIFTLDNGQVWKEASGSKLRDSRFQGRLATISKGMFGSWHIKVEGVGASGRVIRLR